MKKCLFRSGMIILLGVSWVFQSGCAGSPATRYYLLISLSTPSPEPKPMSGESCLSIGVGPINMPAYLDPPNIVTRTDTNQLLLAEFDHWAESLKDNFTRVFAQNLSALVCTKTVVVFPWRGKIPIDYRIEIDVLRFDGTLKKDVSLEAWWRLFNGDGKTMILSKKINLSEPVNGGDYKSFVSAQSRILEKLSREIVQAIKNLPR